MSKGEDNLDSKLYTALVNLDKELAAYLKAHHIDVTRIGPRKVAFICTKCQRSFRARRGGMECPGCGEFVRVHYPDGHDLTLHQVLGFMEDDDKAA